MCLDYIELISLILIESELVILFQLTRLRNISMESNFYLFLFNPLYILKNWNTNTVFDLTLTPFTK